MINIQKKIIDTVLPQTVYQCPECDFYSQLQIEVERHWLLIHSGIKVVGIENVDFYRAEDEKTFASYCRRVRPQYCDRIKLVWQGPGLYGLLIDNPGMVEEDLSGEMVPFETYLSVRKNNIKINREVLDLDEQIINKIEEGYKNV